MRFQGANWKRWANAGGAILGVAGVAFLAFQLRRYGASVDPGMLRRPDWIAFVALIVLGVLMNGCLGLAWRAVLTSSGVSVSVRWAVATYAVTHVARYVPGNIFHYAGRQAVGMAAGLPARALARASLLELLMVGASGLVLGLFAAPLLLPLLQGAAWRYGVSVAVMAALYGVRRLAGSALSVATGLYLLYLTLSGLTFLVFTAVNGGTSNAGSPDLVAIGGAYVVAWLIGMLTPGAPAGLGVREAVVLFFLSDFMDTSILLFAVLATRIVAVCADALACLVGLALRTRQQRHAS